MLGILDDAPVLVVDLESGCDELVGVAPPPWLPCLVIGVSPTATGRAPDGVDVALSRGTLDTGPAGWVCVPDLEGEVGRAYRAATAGAQASVLLAQVLRTSEHLDLETALVVESLAYSTLQAGPRFRSWLAARAKPKVTEDPEHVVLARRADDVLEITLNRPRVRNAVSLRLRDELCAALTVACADPSVDVRLRGAGDAFCSGGDLNEFGMLPDPVTAHLIRTTRSPARLMATLSSRLSAYVHGATVGAGIELAAFADRVVSAADARFSLPETEFGLIPGAGGTVSIPRRIGRHRTMWLALGSTLDARAAHRWGLVDELSGA